MNEKSYRVIIERPAWRQLMNLDEKTQDRINDVIHALENEPRPSGCKKLRGAQFSFVFASATTACFTMCLMMFWLS